jgi:hypothetical protein
MVLSIMLIKIVCELVLYENLKSNLKIYRSIHVPKDPNYYLQFQR